MLKINKRQKPSNNNTSELPKVVVIGSGISGLATAWLLENSGEYNVTLLEASDKFGGHANAVPVTLKERNKLGIKKTKTALVDTGFLVFNHKTYPHLTNFFHHLNVKVADSDMGFGLSVRKGKELIEWCGSGLSGVFAQKKRIFSPSHLRMVYEIVRMQKDTDKLIDESKKTGATLGELLKKHNYSQAFSDNYLLPMAAAIWSTSVSDIRDFPARTFLTFCKNHVLLDISGRPLWKTVHNTSAQYVQAVISQLSHAKTNHRVTSIKKKSNGGYQVDFNHLEQHTSKKFVKSLLGKHKTGSIEADIIVMACHTDTASKIVQQVATKSQLDILNSIQYSDNTAFLHTDKNQMPKNKKVWSSWNYLSKHLDADISQTNSSDASVTISYWSNKLQPFLPFKTDIFVTLNPIEPIEKSKVLASFQYAHPQFNQTAIDAQQRLPKVQGDNNLYFAGAWTRYGFHEDGILSAVKVAERLGVTTPWEIPADWDKNYAEYAKELVG